MSYILVLIAGVSWGLIGVFTKVIDVLGFTEMQMLFVKGVLAAALLFLITFFLLVKILEKYSCNI